MPLITRPLREEEVEQALRIQYVAFDRPGTMGSLFSSDPSPDGYVKSKRQSRIDEMRRRKTGRFMVVEDKDTQQVISVAHWDMYPEERTAEDVEYICRKSDPPPDAHAQAWKDFFGFVSESRRKTGTRPMAFLYTLVTDPARQMQGAGRMLMNSLVQEADKLGLDIHLEASERGKQLYESVGFLPQDERVFKLHDYGLQGKESLTVMLRPTHDVSEA